MDRNGHAQSEAGSESGAEAALIGPAWEARRLLRSVRQASLATVGAGGTFASLVTPALAPDGAVLMFLSELSEHTRHLRCEPNCSLLFVGTPASVNPQTAPRITVGGRAEVSADALLKAHWLSVHPYAAFYAELPDFALWRVLPDSGFYVGGFARAVHLPGEALRPSAGDVAAVAAAAPSILAHYNADHGQALAELAAGQGGAGAWTIVGVDCDGFDLLQDERVLRIAFPRPVRDAAGVRSALMTLLSQSRGTAG